MFDLPLAVASRIALLALVVAVGVWARRTGRLDAGGVGALSRLVVDAAWPALVFTRLLTSVTAADLAAEWPVPLAAALSLAGGWWIGRRVLGEVSVAWLAGLPNWIFLPLLIAEATQGPAGVRAVFLFNVGAELCLWTVGVALLVRGDGRAPVDRRQLWGTLARNPGLWAALLGTLGALAWPGLVATAAAPRAATGAWAPVGLLLEALALLGAFAVPGSLLVTGGLLGELSRSAILRPSARLWRVLGWRLVLSPAVGLGILTALPALGVQLPATARFMVLVTWAMPVAISGSVYLRRFGGDVALGSQAVVWSTLLGGVTVPAWVLGVGWLWGGGA